MSLKRTPLYEEHMKLGARIVDFGGWEMPVQYKGVIEEHITCRKSLGIFDASHMGEFVVTGKDTLAFLNTLVTNNVSTMTDGQAQYTAMCNEHGGIIDDLITYRFGPEHYFVVVNASNTEKDFAQFLEVAKSFQVRCENHGDRYALIALQGRNAEKCLATLTTVDLTSMKYYRFATASILGAPVIIARTGYTGEDGFEVFCPPDKARSIWSALLEKGTAYSIAPCGLAARDTLRTEMKFALYGNELSEKTNPLEAGLGWVVKFDKGRFVGSDAIAKIREMGPARKLVGLELLDRGIARHDYKIFSADEKTEIGTVTSGTHAPSLKKSIAIGYVRSADAAIGTEVRIDIRGQKTLAKVVKTPFYTRDY